MSHTKGIPLSIVKKFIKRLVVFCALAVALPALHAYGGEPDPLPPASTFTGAYQLVPGGLTENFDSMGITGTKPPSPNGSSTYWAIYNKNKVTPTLLNNSSAGDENGKSYNGGLSGNADRALGLYVEWQYAGHEQENYLMRAKFQNSTGSALTKIEMYYDLELWSVRDTSAHYGGFNLMYSTDYTTWYDMGSAFDTSLSIDVSSSLPANNWLTASTNPTYLQMTKTDIGGTYTLPTSLANGGTFYLEWQARTGIPVGTGTAEKVGVFIDNFELQPANLNNSTITAPASQPFGRVMFGQTPTGSLSLSKTGTEATTYTATPSNSGLIVTADGLIAGGSQGENITVGLVNNTNGSGSTGAKSWTVTIDNLATTSAGANQGSADPNDSISVSATVLNNRTVSGSAVNAGRIMVNQTSTSSLSTSGDDNNVTRVTVATTASQNADGVSVTGGTGTLFNATGSTGSRTFQFSSTGSKGGSITLATTGEGLTGESPINVPISYTATVLDNRTITANSGARVDLGLVMAGQTATSSGPVNFNFTSTSGDDTSKTRVTVLDSSATDGRVTVASGAQLTFNGTNTLLARSVSLTTPFSDAGAHAGMVNMNVVGEGLAGETDSASVGYTVSVLNDRIVTGNGGSNVNLGRVMVGQSSTTAGPANFNFTSTSGDDSIKTRVTVLSSAATDGHVTVEYGSGLTFNGTNTVLSRTASLTSGFSGEGMHTGTVNMNVSGYGLVGETDSASVGYTVDALLNRVITGYVSLGRVLAGQPDGFTQPITFNLTSTSGDDTTRTRVTVLGTSATDGLATVNAGPSLLFDGTNTTLQRTLTLSPSFVTSGQQAGTIHMNVTGEGLAGEVDDAVVIYSVTAVTDRVITANGGSSVNLGRVMLNQTNTSTGPVNFDLTSTTGDGLENTRVTVLGTSANDTYVSVASGLSMLFDGSSVGPLNRTISLAAGFNGAGTHTGTVNMNVSGEGLPGEHDSAVVPYTINAVNNRTLNATYVNLGACIVDGTADSQIATISSAANTDNTLTRVTLGATSQAGTGTPSGTTITLDSGTAYQYGGAHDAINSTTRGISGSFTTIGVKSGVAAFNPTGEGLSGESVQPFNVNYSALVYDHATKWGFEGGTLTLPDVIVGYTEPVASTNSLAVTNGGESDMRVNLKGSAPDSGNLSLGSMDGIVAGMRGAIVATLASGEGVSTISKTFTYTFADDSMLNGNSSNVGTAPISVTGRVLDHGSAWLNIYSYNFGRVIHDTSVAGAQTILSNASGTRAGIDVLDTGGLTLNGYTPIYPGSGRFLTATVNTSATGAQSTPHTIAISDDLSILGHALLPSLTFTVEGTVVVERTVTADPVVSMGKVLVSTPGTGNVVLTTTGEDNQFTRVKVSGGSYAEVSISSSDTPFEGPGQQTRTVSGTFTQSGTLTRTVFLHVTGEGLTGEETYDPISVEVTTDVYEAASLHIADGTSLRITNDPPALGSLRAAARLTEFARTGGDLDTVLVVNDLPAGPADVGAVIPATGIPVTATLSLPGNPLNGTYSTTYDATFEHADRAIQGTSDNDLGTYSVLVNKSVSDNSGAQSVELPRGRTYAGLYGLSDESIGTRGDLLGGVVGGTDPSRTISMDWKPASTGPGIGGDFFPLSDVVCMLSGFGNDTFVLQLNYKESLLRPGISEAWLVGREKLCVAWNNNGIWENAVEGNKDSSTLFAGNRAYNPNTDFVLGKWGVDTTANVVWAVINHNSDFVPGYEITPEDEASLPEPSALSIIGLALFALRKRRS